jgi:DNA polymerase III subunit delta
MPGRPHPTAGQPGVPPNQSAVLVDGDDPTLVAEEVSVVIAGLVGVADRSLAVEDHRGEEVDLAAVADSCATPPFLADRRIVVVRDVGRFSTEEVAPLLAYLEDPLPTTVLVLAAGQGPTAPRLTAAVKARGHVRSTRVAGRQTRDWVRGRLRQAPVRFDGPAETLIENHLGEDVSRLGALLAVLATAYGEGQRLGPAQVEPYLGEAGSVAPWDFTDAIDAGRTGEALVLLHRLLEGGERHPLVVLAILHRHVQSLLRVDGADIRTETQAAAALGIAQGRSTFPAKKALTASRRWGTAGIADGVALVADAELDLKGRISWSGEAVLEVLVARLCRLARARAGPPPDRAGRA